MNEDFEKGYREGYNDAAEYMQKQMERLEAETEDVFDTILALFYKIPKSEMDRAALKLRCEQAGGLRIINNADL